MEGLLIQRTLWSGIVRLRPHVGGHGLFFPTRAPWGRRIQRSQRGGRGRQGEAVRRPAFDKDTICSHDPWIIPRLCFRHVVPFLKTGSPFQFCGDASVPTPLSLGVSLYRVWMPDPLYGRGVWGQNASTQHKDIPFSVRRSHDRLYNTRRIRRR